MRDRTGLCHQRRSGPVRRVPEERAGDVTEGQGEGAAVGLGGPAVTAASTLSG